jgi:hypothetical protein
MHTFTRWLTRKLARVALVVGGLISLDAMALPVQYQLQFKVTDLYDHPATPLDPSVTIGSLFYGSFGVDDGLLAVDGLNQAAIVNNLRIDMGNTWCYNLACVDNVFAGFRGPGGLGSTSPGFDVAGSEVVNLRGGVYGMQDFPFVDFSFIIGGGPSEGCGPYCGNEANRFSTVNALGAFAGIMTVTTVPEPLPLALFGLGLIALLGRRLVRRGTPYAAESAR